MKIFIKITGIAINRVEIGPYWLAPLHRSLVQNSQNLALFSLHSCSLSCRFIEHSRCIPLWAILCD